MRRDTQPGERKGLMSSGSEFDRKYRVALVLYAALAALSWFTLGEGKIFVEGRAVELRLLPLIIIGGMALKTVLARQADKIRRDGNGSSGSNSQ